MIKLLIGGSPCTHWSIAQKNGRETEPRGLGWELFENYMIAKEKFKPDFFLYENNKSASQAIKDQISRELGVGLVYINSSLVSAQNRQRFYAFNWEVTPPEDRRILLKQILPKHAIPLNTTVDGKAQCLRSTCYKDGIRNLIANNVDRRTCVAMPSEFCDDNYKVFGVENGQVDINGVKYKCELPNGNWGFRKLNVEECCLLQTIPTDYFQGHCKTKAFKGLGNGWTAEIIIHILNGVLKDVPRDEEIVVLSMYDGIGTGRYCLDKMGFNNVKYYAYEIDENAIKVALDNYPDIIQCGDAFSVRDDNWAIERRRNNAE